MAAGAASVGMAGLQMYEAKNQADALKRQSAFEAKQMEFNAQLTDIRREEVGEQRDKDIVRRESQIKQMIGSQKSSMAASGIELDSELAEQIESDSLRTGAEDVQMIKNNAWKQAWGLEMEAQDLRSQAGFTRLGGKQRARQTLTTGGVQAIGSLSKAYAAR